MQNCTKILKMKLSKKLRILSEIKLFLKSESTVFLIDTLKKRKKYLIINIFSGLSDAFLELITISMLYFIVFILTSESNEVINWEGVFFINKFPALIDYINGFPFKTVFSFSIFFTVIIQIAQLLFRYLNNLSASWIEASYLALITRNIYSFIFRLSYKYSSKYKMGDLADYINSSPLTIKTYINNLNQLILNLCITFVYILLLIQVSFWNILILISILFLSNKLRSTLLPRVKFLSSKVLRNTVALSESIIEKFQALRFINSNGLNDFAVDNMNKETAALENSLRKISYRIHLLPSLVSLSPIILLASIAIAYSFFSEKNALISTLCIFFISIQRINTRFIGIATNLSLIAESEPRLNRTIQLFQGKDLQFRRIGDKFIRFPVKEIIFSRVNFKYSKSSKFSLEDLNFSLRAGQVTAIVGLSGSGKSSILDLLTGLFEPNFGKILINGNNLKDINLNNWQREISVVSQDCFLLNDSIINNIKFGLGKVSFKDIKKACIQSGSHEFIERLPNSYNTIVGERGFKLSGGERQRISIARAFLKESSLLILDEATSALDSQNEEFIKQNIAINRFNKIILIVAHRLSTIREADNILVLDQGRIVERGNHEFLLDQKQIYKKLWEMQSKK